jgi:hypothetical protein
MDYKKITEKVYEDLENERLVQAITSCLRLARLNKDYRNLAIFLREITSDKVAFCDVFWEATRELKEDAQKFLYDMSFKRWVEERTVCYDPKATDDEKIVYPLGVGELLSEIEQLEKGINEISTPQGMTPYDTAYFEDRNIHTRVELRNRIRAMNTIKDRIRSRCFNYIIEIEKQLHEQEKTQSFIFDVQNNVNNFFKGNNQDIYDKLKKATELSNSTNKEDYSLLLTEIRRILKSIADFFYPAQEDKVICSDGAERILDDARYINRIQEYLSIKFGDSKSDELLKAEYKYLSNFIRKLNSLASKGVHADVDFAEAKQGFLCLYMFLNNMINCLQLKK